MIKKESLEIVSINEIAKDTIEMVLKNEYISEHASPGQFLHIAVANHTLRRPISIATTNKEDATVTILFKLIGTGTEDLADYQVGQVLDALGPAGNGFPLENLDKSQTVLLVGGGIGVPPIYFLGMKLKELGYKVQSIIGFQSEEFVFYEEKFAALGDVHVVTNDGSYGKAGFVTDAMDDIEAFSRYYTCGPKPMLQAVTNRLPDHDGFISFEERMGCGVGACFACVLPTKDESGYKKICQDGPVFHVDEVIL